METTLHRQLKALYAGDDANREVRVAGFRIDAISEDELVEVQLGSLGALRDKTRKLLGLGHRVRIVKPLVQEKRLIQLSAKGGKVLRSRRSPKREEALDLFNYLIHFTNVFPHPRLTLEIPFVSVEETRFPGHGKRRRWREKDFLIEDLKLLEVSDTVELSTTADLIRLLNVKLPKQFHSGDLAGLLNCSRWMAQRVAYCLREMKGIEVIGKEGNAWVYQPLRGKRRKVA